MAGFLTICAVFFLMIIISFLDEYYKEYKEKKKLQRLNALGLTGKYMHVKKPGKTILYVESTIDNKSTFKIATEEEIKALTDTKYLKSVI